MPKKTPTQKSELEVKFYALLLTLSDTIRKHNLEEALVRVAEQIVKGIVRGGCVYAFGNGGSASEADHFVGELAGAFEDRERPAMKAVALSAQPASQTAIANDFGYEEYPARLIGSMSEHDTLVLLSTSGTSKNVLRAIEVASELPKSPYLVLICGSKLKGPSILCDRIVVASEITSTIQEATLFILHQLASRIERTMKGLHRGG